MGSFAARFTIRSSLLLALLLAACAPAAPQPGGAQQPSAKSDQAARRTLTVAYTSDLEGINPFSHSTSTVYARWMHVCDPLVWHDTKANAWVPHLAESWTNPDANTWEFKLRQGVKFHDGSELIADDVVFSYNRLINDKESKQAPTLSGVDKIEAPDKYTVRIHTKTPDAAFVGRLDNRVIMSKAYHEKLGTEAADKAQIGTGAYKFKEWVPGQRFVVVKNPDYWGPFKPVWDEVVFRPIPEDEARITALLNGEVDVIANVPPQNVERLNSSGSARAVGTRGDRMLFVGMNPTTIEPFKSQQVRQAVAHAIDKDSIVKGILQGRAYRLDGPLGPTMLSYDPNLQPQYPYDPEKARQLLAEGGFPNGFEVDFYSPVDRYIKDKDISAAIAGMLGKVGIKANLKTPEWGTFSDQYQKGLYPMYLIGRGNVSDPSEYLHQYFRTGVTKRLMFSDPEVDAALLAEQKEFDPKKRIDLLRKAQAIIMQRSPAVFLLQYEDTYGAHNRVDFDPRSDEYIFAWDVKPKG
jgi:peptide/nickel transport system substrate-binding protein